MARGDDAWTATKRWVVELSLALVGGGVFVAFETAVYTGSIGLRLHDAAMLDLRGDVNMARRVGYAASLVTAALSVAAIDFLFVVPYFSFAVEDKRYLLTLVIMFSVAFAISNRTEAIRRSESAARRREMRTARLYAMSRELAVATSTDEIVRAAYSHLRDAFGSEVRALLLDGNTFRDATGAPVDLPGETDAAARAMWAPGGEPLVTTGGGTRLALLGASAGPLGVLVVPPASKGPREDPSHGDLLETFASQIALAIERARSAEDAQRAQLLVQNERLRNALLSSVSHDLRTPLAVIKGAVTALVDPGSITPARHAEYVATISDEASRLDRLVRNLLDVTSLEAGAMRVRNKEWQSLEEVIGVALNRLEEQLGRRSVEVRVPAAATLAPFDATLVGQVFTNLVENAIKYSPPTAFIEINARPVDRGVEVEVADSGPGVPVGHEEAVFEKFHRAGKATPGMGIGLTICRGIVAAHGGRIWYEHRVGGGVVLPLRPSSRRRGPAARGTARRRRRPLTCAAGSPPWPPGSFPGWLFARPSRDARFSRRCPICAPPLTMRASWSRAAVRRARRTWSRSWRARASTRSGPPT